MTEPSPVPSGPPLRVDVVTLFPNLFDSWLAQGVVSRAVSRGVALINLVDLRGFGIGRHLVTDDYPFGGGPGMVMKPEPLFAAVESLDDRGDAPVILLSPGGKRLDQAVVRRLSSLNRFVLVAGHYEGVDDRVRQHLITEELSIGDYILSAGELAAMVVVDAVVRLRPGALAATSADEESFADGLLEYPQYTRPARFREWSVPDVLLSGHHAQVRRWRRAEALRRTQLARADLLEDADLTDDDREIIADMEMQLSNPPGGNGTS